MNQENKDKFIYVRQAGADDMEIVLKLIQELADFEKMSYGPKLTKEDLIRDSGLNGGKDFFHCYIAEAKITGQSLREIIGYAICFFSYSTWKGKSYFLEDLYVKPEYRQKDVGRFLFTEVVRKAKEFNCSRVDFHVLDWNPAKDFYNKMGAKNLTEQEGWQFYRLEVDEFLNGHH